MYSHRQEILKQKLLQTLGQELDLSLSLVITDLAGELGGYIMGQNEWPELLQYAYEHLQVKPHPHFELVRMYG